MTRSVLGCSAGAAVLVAASLLFACSSSAGGAGEGTEDAGADPGRLGDSLGGDALPADSGSASGDQASSDATPTGSDSASDPGGLEPDPGPPACGKPNGLRPPRLSEHEGIWDPVRKHIVIFGGSTAVPENCGFVAATFQPETWIYDTTCELWSRLDTGPPPRARHMAAYDGRRDRMLIFGGRSRPGTSGPYTLHDDVWALDLGAGVWSDLKVPPGPSGRVNAAMVYDPKGDRLVLFGGNGSTSGMVYKPLDDVWTLDLKTKTWTRHDPTGGPEARLFMGALWDPSRGSMVIHGGADATAFGNTAVYFHDVWALDLSGGAPAWKRLDDPAAGHPDGRFWGRLVLDPKNDRYVLFGGHDSGVLGNRNDTQAFYPEIGAWVTLRQGDVWNKPANGFCSFPPDFTTLDMQAPERRNAHILVAGQDMAYTVGGKTDCGVTDDVWSFDFSRDTWARVLFATLGESCLRQGGQGCHDLCF